jgi:hypothetical protein
VVGLLHRAAEGPSAQSVSGTRSLMRHRALRVLLSYPNRKWHQNELAQDVDVDPGSHVNRVVKFLLQEHYADYDGRGPGEVIFVTRPGGLLDTWRGCWEHMWNALRRASAGLYSLAMDTTMSVVPPAMRGPCARCSCVWTCGPQADATRSKPRTCARRFCATRSGPSRRS